MAKIQDSTNLYLSNILIVDPNGHSPFTTIAAALTAATDMGLNTTGCTIYLRPSTYTENLTLVAGVNIIGDQYQTTIIEGTHTVPAAGKVMIENVKLSMTTPATNIFVEAGAGTAEIYLKYCQVYLHSGMLFYLPLSTGALNLNNCFDSSLQNSVIDNTTGKSIFSVNHSTIGAGSVAALIAGNTAMNRSTFNCPLTISSNSTGTAFCCSFTGSLTLSDTASYTIYHSKIETGASACITANVGTVVTLSDVVLNSSAANIVTGAGAVTYNQVTAINAFTHNATTENYTGRTITGSLQLDETNTGVPYFTAGVMGSTADLTDGQMLIGNTGNPPSVGTISAAAGSGITVTAGAGTLALASTAPMSRADISADGALAVNTSYTNTKAGLLTVTLPDGTANDEIILIGNGAGGWIIDQTDAAHQIFVGNTQTTLGAAGSLASSNNGDCVLLRCLSAKTWRVYSMVGNLTVV